MQIRNMYSLGKRQAKYHHGGSGMVLPSSGYQPVLLLGHTELR
jgi:hypothetical protein